MLALPANAELTDADHIELARSFAEQHFVAKGLAVQPGHGHEHPW